MVNNSVTFNGEDNDITHIGQTIRSQILMSIDVEEKVNSTKKIPVEKNTKTKK